MNDKSLSQEVLNAIESRGIRPRGKVSVWAGWAAVWCVWALVLVVGALAVSGTIFAIALSQWQFRRVTDQSFLGLFADSLPLLWTAFIALAIVLLTEIYRRTGAGYRASTLWVVAMSLVGTGLVGGLLYTIGVGELVEREIGARIPAHRTVDERNAMRLSSALRSEFVRVGEVSQSIGEGGVPVYTLQSVTGGEVSVRFSRPELAKRCLGAGRSVQLLGYPEHNGSTFVVCDAQSIVLDPAHRDQLKAAIANHSIGMERPLPSDCDELYELLARERSR